MSLSSSPFPSHPSPLSLPLSLPLLPSSPPSPHTLSSSLPSPPLSLSRNFTGTNTSQRRRWAPTEPTIQPSISDIRSGSPGGHSQLSITTLDIDSLAARDRERERRLETIFNARAKVNVDDRTVLQTFVERNDSHPQQQTRSNRSASHLVSRASERSLDAESAFKPISTPTNN